MESLEDRAETDISPGDWVTIKGVQFTVWQVTAVGICEYRSDTRPEHPKYQIDAPEGAQDWWCSYEVRKAP